MARAAVLRRWRGAQACRRAGVQVCRCAGLQAVVLLARAAVRARGTVDVRHALAWMQRTRAQADDAHEGAIPRVAQRVGGQHGPQRA